MSEAQSTTSTSTDLALIQEKAAALFAGDHNPFLDDADSHGVTDNARLRFSGNTGVWTIGKDPVENGYQFIFNVMEVARGWVAWKNNKPVDQVWASVMKREPLPRDDSELKDHWDGVPRGKRPKETDGWAYVVKFTVADPATGINYELTLPGDGTYRPANRLIKQFGQQFKFHPDGAGSFKMPIIEIDSEAFDGKGGKKFSPILTIVGWCSVKEMSEMASEMVEPKEDEKPVTSSTAAAQPKGDNRVEKAPPQEAPAAAPGTKFRRQRVGA
jgi:hypothetical protein